MSVFPAPPSVALPPVPTRAEVNAAIPDHCFERNLRTSLGYAAFSLVITLLTGAIAWQYIPLTLAMAPVWIAYALICGTFATGVWVVAHECGHGAFSDNDRIQDGVGYVLHSVLLVPYFSWQRSHAIHHAKTNHVADGETWRPAKSATGRVAAERSIVGGARTLASNLGLGWPIYLLAGATGGVDRGVTNHFWPWKPFSQALFPRRMVGRIVLSTVGVVATVSLLVWWAIASGNVLLVLAVYGGPYLVTNAWLTAYTWLQHTDVDIPHYDDEDWTFVRGAFCSVDRPYGRVFDLLHHRIGSTHVAHHLSARIPHYRAAEATRAIAEAFPHLYRFDPTPVPKAMWRVARRCSAVHETDDGWRFSGQGGAPAGV